MPSAFSLLQVWLGLLRAIKDDESPRPQLGVVLQVGLFFVADKLGGKQTLVFCWPIHS